MSPVERTLAELRSALGDRLPPGASEARLREAKGHLLLAAAELGEVEAVRRFGPARLVANAMVRAHRGYETAGAGRLALGAGALMFLAVFLPYTYMQVSLGRPEELNKAIVLVEWVPIFGLLAFMGRVVQTRRWLVLPGALWSAAACVAVLAVSVGVNPTIDARDLPAVRENTRKEVALWTERAADVAAWQRGEYPLRAPFFGRTYGTAHYGFAAFPTSEEYLSGERVESREAAKAAWETNGAAWTKEVSERLDDARSSLAALPSMFPPHPIPWPRLAVMAATGTLWSVVFLSVANGLALAACALSDRRRMWRA